MPVSASRSRSADDRRVPLRAAVAVGDVWQLGDGAAGGYSDRGGAATTGQTVQFLAGGIYVCPLSERRHDPRRRPLLLVAEQQDGELPARGAGTSTSAAPWGCEHGGAVHDGRRQRQRQPAGRPGPGPRPVLSIAVGTSAAGGFAPGGGPTQRGGALKFALTATNEAQKVDALGKDGLPAGLASASSSWPSTSSAAASAATDVFSLGIASATHATAVTSITQSLCVQLKGGDTKVYVESKDGTHTVAATDTTKTYTAGVGSQPTGWRCGSTAARRRRCWSTSTACRCCQAPPSTSAPRPDVVSAGPPAEDLLDGHDGGGRRLGAGPHGNPEVMPGILAIGGLDAARQGKWDRVFAALRSVPSVHVTSTGVQQMLGLAVQDGLLTSDQVAAIGVRQGSRAEVLFGPGVAVGQAQVSLALRGV
jgi:hypothetical protein